MVVPSRPMPHTIMEVKYEASQSCRGGESRSISGKKASSWRGNNGGAKVLIRGAGVLMELRGEQERMVRKDGYWKVMGNEKL